MNIRSTISNVLFFGLVLILSLILFTNTAGADNLKRSGEWNQEGLKLVGSGNFNAAVKAFSKAIELNPADSVAYLLRGVVYSKLKNNQQAIKDFSKAIELNPQNTMAYVGRSEAYVKLGNYQQAIEDNNKAIEIDPQFEGAYYNMACLYALQKKTEEACKYLQSAIACGFNNWQHLKEDKDLDNIRNESCFIDLMKTRGGWKDFKWGMSADETLSLLGKNGIKPMSWILNSTQGIIYGYEERGESLPSNSGIIRRLSNDLFNFFFVNNKLAAVQINYEEKESDAVIDQLEKNYPDGTVKYATVGCCEKRKFFLYTTNSNIIHNIPGMHGQRHLWYVDPNVKKLKNNLETQKKQLEEKKTEERWKTRF